MKNLARWWITPMRLLPWYHSLLIGTFGGCLIGISIGILIGIFLTR